MNVAKLYALVAAYKQIGLSDEDAFERAFAEYKALMEVLKKKEEEKAK